MTIVFQVVFAVLSCCFVLKGFRLLLHILPHQIRARLHWQPIRVFSLLHPFLLLVGGINLCRGRKQHSNMKEKDPITPLSVFILSWKQWPTRNKMYIAYKLPAAELLPLLIPNFQVFIQVTFFLYGTESKHRRQWAAGGRREPTWAIIHTGRKTKNIQGTKKNMYTNPTEPYGKYIYVNKKKRLRVTENNRLTVSVFGDPAEGLHPLQRTDKTTNFSSLGLVHGGSLWQRGSRGPQRNSAVRGRWRVGWLVLRKVLCWRNTGTKVWELTFKV